MKLTREELTRAKEKQLQRLGIKRVNNKGWLYQALRTEFTEEQVREFRHRDSLRQLDLWKQQGRTITTRRPPRSTDGKAEQFANQLYEESSRNLA